MFFTYDIYKNIQILEVYLAYKDKRNVCAIKAYELKCKTRFASISTGSFKIYRFENDSEVFYWNKIQIGMLIEIRYVSWFTISDIKLNKSEDGNEYMEISLQSLENETCQTYLTAFGSLGIDIEDDDDKGGLYCLCNEFDTNHSIMHIFRSKNPGWKIGYIDPDISTQYRSFTEDSVVSYEFLTGKVAQVYECVFIFDVYERSVNAYKIENIGKTTSIFLSDRNLIKEVNVKSDDSDIKTVFNVSGGNDSRTNTSLTISDVNPSGNTSISNFSYYYSQMSAELVYALKEYSKMYEQNEPLYSSSILVLERLYAELDVLNNNIPEDHETADLTKLGLAELIEREKTHWGVMSVNIKNSEGKDYQNARIQREKVLKEIEVRKSQISAKEQEIENQKNIINSYVVNIQDVLGDDLYKELSYFVREQDFQDDSFVATAEMTQDEILKMQEELMSHAQKELAKVSYPQFEMTIDVINFTAIEDFQKYTDQLELGNIITVEWEPGVLIEARILGMNLDFENPDKFEIIISNKNSLDELWSLLAEIREQAGSTASSVDYNKGAWNIAKDTSLDFKQFMNSIFDASLKKLQNSDNQEVLIDHTGIILRRWLEDQNKYSPNQVWMTNGQIAFTRDNWNHVCTVLGELTLPDGTIGYGIAGQYIIGEIISGEHLILKGSCASLVFETNDSFNNAVTEIKANQGEILLRVKKNEVINEINISTEGIRINGNRILLDGDVTFSNTNKFGIDGDVANITNIDGGNIKTHTITATQIAANTITGDEIKAHTITSNNLYSDNGWVDFLDTIDFTAKKIECGNGFLTGGPGYVTLGDLEVYTFHGNTYLGAPNHNIMGISANEGVCFYAGWQGENAYGGHGSASFQVNGSGELYVSHILVNKIEARNNSKYNNKIEFHGGVDFSNATVTGLPTSGSNGVSSSKFTEGLIELGEIIDEQWSNHTSIATAIESWLNHNL